MQRRGLARLAPRQQTPRLLVDRRDPPAAAAATLFSRWRTRYTIVLWYRPHYDGLGERREGAEDVRVLCAELYWRKLRQTRWLKLKAMLSHMSFYSNQTFEWKNRMVGAFKPGSSLRRLTEPLLQRRRRLPQQRRRRRRVAHRVGATTTTLFFLASSKGRAGWYHHPPRHLYNSLVYIIRSLCPPSLR